VPELSINVCMLYERGNVISDSEENACVSAHLKPILQRYCTFLEVMLTFNLIGPSLFIQSAVSVIPSVRGKIWIIECSF